MFHVYRVFVVFRLSSGKPVINKCIIRYRVVVMSGTHLQLTTSAEGNPNGRTLRVPCKDCFVDLLDAKKEAQEQTERLITVMSEGIKELRSKPIQVIDSPDGDKEAGVDEKEPSEVSDDR